MANNMGVLNSMLPPHMVAIQLNCWRAGQPHRQLGRQQRHSGCGKGHHPQLLLIAPAMAATPGSPWTLGGRPTLNRS